MWQPRVEGEPPQPNPQTAVRPHCGALPLGVRTIDRKCGVRRREGLTGHPGGECDGGTSA